MTCNDYGIDIVEKLDSLIDLIIEKYHVDIIAPIERKGIRVLELSKHAEKLFDGQKVLYYSSLKFHAKELKNKKIVLFDESVGTGRSLSDKLNALESLSKKKKLNLHIKTAALLINEKVEYLPNFYLSEMIIDQNLYNSLSSELVQKILSTGKPLDVDHPIAILKIKEGDIPFLLNNLSTISYSRELDHSNEFSDVRLFTVDFKDKFKIPKFDQYPKLFDDGPKKIRLFLKGTNLACIPIVFPCMDISEETLNKLDFCQFCKLDTGTSMCKVIDLKNTLETGKNKIREFQSNLCYQCITYELNCRLLGLFLYELNKKMKIEFEELEERNLSAIYHNEARDIKANLERKIRNYFNGTENPSFIEDAAESCNLPSLPEMGRNYFIDDIRPEYEVSGTIAKNSSLNNSLFRHANYQFEHPKLGLSYKQIYETLPGIDEHDFSEGMDIALDIGLIKPEIPYQGLNIVQKDKPFLGITRIYCTSSENIHKSLNFFFNLVTKEHKA